MHPTPVEVDTKPAAKVKRTLKPGMGKGKGNGFEGLVAKKLTAGLQPLNFMRTPGSGARVGGKNFETLGQMLGEDALKIFVGDVVPVNERKEGLTFKYVIECKSYATTDNFTSLVSGSANIFKWYEEVIIDAAKVNKKPLLICKWNHTPIYVISDTFEDMPGIKPSLSLLRYVENGKGQSLDVFLFDNVITHPAFWYSKTP